MESNSNGILEDIEQLKKQTTLLSVLVGHLLKLPNCEFDIINNEIIFYENELRKLNIPMKIARGDRPEFKVESLEDEACLMCSG